MLGADFRPKSPSTHARTCGRCSPLVRKSAICCSVGTLEPHSTILNDFVGEVLPNVDVLGSFSYAYDVVAPFNARDVVLVDRDGLLLLESETVQKSLEVQNLTASRRC